MDNLITVPASNFLHNEENISSYCEGGFHPVQLGDHFKGGRYEVVHKLGWGGFSTAWLAKDKTNERWVALKICRAKGTASKRELSTLQLLQETDSRHLVTLYDEFVHAGANGSHICIVFESLGPSLRSVIADYHEVGDRLEPDEILRLTRELLQATASLHDAGFAHGDISGDNIAFTTKNLQSLSEEAFWGVVGRPETVELLAADGSLLSPSLPKQLVRKVNWDSWVDEDEEDLRLVDFGETFRIESPPKVLPQPGPLRAPERLLTDSLDHRVDLWRVGSVIISPPDDDRREADDG